MQLIRRNKKLLRKYPWLKPVNLWTMTPIETPDFSFISIWDEIPNGWTSIFGRMMCDEIQKALQETNADKKAYVEQAKEKYGGLRLYMVANHEAQEVIDIYERISENICVRCGRPHVPMLDLSWMSPYCKKCYETLQKKNKYFYQKPYETYVPENKDEWRIPNVLQWKRSKPDSGPEILEIDISDRVKKIEDLWNRRHPDDPV